MLFNIETILLATYIFAWQYPHFYGILYANKEDYKNAGFKMISNDDPKGLKATNHIIASTVLNSVVPLAMTYTGMINPIFLVPFYLY